MLRRPKGSVDLIKFSYVADDGFLNHPLSFSPKMSTMEKQTQSHATPRFLPQRHHSLPNGLADTTQSSLTPYIKPFAGRLGGVQDFVLDRSDPANASILQETPDAAPLMSLRETFSLRGFRSRDMWEAAVIEGLGSMLLVYLTTWIAAHPAGPPVAPDSLAGVYSTSAFFGPLIGGLTNWIILTVFIYSFSSVSGAHLNPTISIATFLARLTSLPRMVLYVAFQTAGGALAGLMLRASYGSRHFDVGGCSVDDAVVSVGEAFSIEFMSTLILLFLAFGVGLDPRQKQIFGPALAPALVGLVLGVISFGTAFTKPGYGGACKFFKSLSPTPVIAMARILVKEKLLTNLFHPAMNPARCLAVYVGTRFPGYHWIHWV
ncbi:uncharacterized protein KY384_008519 [Bacidia gigantensis]|uniref:uncharacterized protein n=1 Tax=Bacidia gigantensis TaxID=2732470 RepID=UPI001D03E175|nr:uncharacterized protein KY384_008519 [Bacidia gigantensis]KAG8527090.1 hypothetical protein KY384_008519 [Bacidia gigantensis]